MKKTAWLSVMALLGLSALLMRFSLGAQRIHGVNIQNLQFAPSAITITPGDSVTWTNRDDRDHKIVADDGSFSSGNLSAGQTFTHAFGKPGKYDYGCTYHPREKGSVIVQ